MSGTDIMGRHHLSPLPAADNHQVLYIRNKCCFQKCLVSQYATMKTAREKTHSAYGVRGRHSLFVIPFLRIEPIVSGSESHLSPAAASALVVTADLTCLNSNSARANFTLRFGSDKANN